MAERVPRAFTGAACRRDECGLHDNRRFASAIDRRPRVRPVEHQPAPTANPGCISTDAILCSVVHNS